MSKGILILALGNELYGKMAVVLAASIKKNSTIPIQLIYSKSSIDSIPQNRIDMLFDIMTECKEEHYIHNGNVEYQKAKLYLNRYSQFNQTIYLDADTIICPGKRVDDLFNKLKFVDAPTFQNIGWYDPIKQEENKEGYLYWGSPEDICKFHGITSKLPKVCSTFIYFNKSIRTKFLFDDAKLVYMNDDCPVDEWNGGKPDEYCFNVALALNNTLPHKVPYMPIHFIHMHNATSKEEIIDNFIGMSNCGNYFPAPLVSIYNDFVDYYFDYFGFKEKYYHINKCEVIETRKEM